MAEPSGKPNRPARIFFYLLAIGAVIWIVFFAGSNLAHMHDMKMAKQRGDPAVTPRRSAP